MPRAHSEFLHLVVTVRASFEPQFTGPEAPLGALWPDARFYVRRMNPAELRQVIEGPAAAQALRFERPDTTNGGAAQIPQRSLVDRLLEDVDKMPGPLPLLSFVLSELYLKLAKHWQMQDARGKDRMLTIQDYNDLGGVLGALVQRASAVYAQLDDDAHKETFRRVLLRMVTLEGGERARRRVPRDELAFPDPQETERARVVMERLVEARLVVDATDAAGVAYWEPAHDVLIQGWPQLAEWIQDEKTLPVQRALTQDAEGWDEAGRPGGQLWDDDPRLPQVVPQGSRTLLDRLGGALWRTARRAVTPFAQAAAALGRAIGPTIAHLRAWRRAVLAMLPPWLRPGLAVARPLALWLNALEQAFVAASYARALRNRRIGQRVATALLALLVVAVIAAFVARQQQQAAVKQEHIAVQQKQFAQQQQKIAVQQKRVAQRQQQIALQQRQAAQQQRNRAEYQATLARTGQLAAQARVHLGDHLDQSLLLAVAATKQAPPEALLDAEGSLLTALHYSPHLITFLRCTHNWPCANTYVWSDAYSPDGRLLATGSVDGSVVLWNATVLPYRKVARIHADTWTITSRGGIL